MKLRLVGPIDDDAVRAVVEAVDSSEPIDILLSSEGGNSYCGLAIYDLLSAHNKKVRVHGVGLIGSAAVAVLAAGDFRSMSPNAFVFVHEEAGEVAGSASNMKVEIRQIWSLEERYNEILASVSEIDKHGWEAYNNETKYLDADACLQIGLIHKIGA